MTKAPSKAPFILLSISSILLSIGYMLAPPVLALAPSSFSSLIHRSLLSMPIRLQDPLSFFLLPLVVGVILWAVSCLLIPKGGVNKIFANLSMIISFIFAGYLLFLTLNHKNIYVYFKYGLDATRLLTAIIPNFILGLFCFSIALLLIFSAIRYKKTHYFLLSIITGILFLLIAGVSFISFDHYASPALFVSVLPVAHLLAAICSILGLEFLKPVSTEFSSMQ